MLHENYIQYLSQIGSLNKVLFLKFFDNIKKLNLNDAKKTFEENDLLQEMGSGVMVETVSPFYPTCCSSMVYMTTEVYKNGLFGMSEGWQAENDYTFYYLTSYKNFLVEFTFSSQFSSFADGSNWSLTETISYGDKKILETPYKKGQNISSKYMKDLFLWKKTQPDFTKELEKAKKQIDDLYN